MRTWSSVVQLLVATIISAALLSVVAGASAQVADSSSASREFDAALVEYENNHWSQAFAALSRLADAGHPKAARMAWQMWRYGAALYGQDFVVTLRQLETWAVLRDRGLDATPAQQRVSAK